MMKKKKNTAMAIMVQSISCRDRGQAFGICQLKPGQVYAPHEHRIMEENFFVIKGRIIVEIDGVATTVEEGQMFHVEPGEFHKVSNPTEDYVRYIITCAPFAENDKYTEKQ